MLLRLSNCVVFATRMYWRRARRGREGYIWMRHSRMTVVGPHWLYAEMRPSGSWRVVSWVPVAPEQHKVAPPLFVGRVKWGDGVSR